MLSFGFFESHVDIVVEIVFQFYDLLLAEQCNIHHWILSWKWRLIFLNLILRVFWTIISEVGIYLFHIEFNFYIGELWEKDFAFCLAFNPKLINLWFLDQDPVSIFLVFILLELQIESTKQVCINISKYPFDVSRRLLLNISLEVIDKLLFLILLRVEALFQNLKTILDDMIKLLLKR